MCLCANSCPIIHVKVKRKFGLNLIKIKPKFSLDLHSYQLQVGNMNHPPLFWWGNGTMVYMYDLLNILIHILAAQFCMSKAGSIFVN